MVNPLPFLLVGGLFHQSLAGFVGEAMDVGGLEIGSYILKSLFISGTRLGEIDFLGDLVGEVGDSFNLLIVLCKLLRIGEFGKDLVGDSAGSLVGEEIDPVGEYCLYFTYCSKSSKLRSLFTVYTPVAIAVRAGLACGEGLRSIDFDILEPDL